MCRVGVWLEISSRSLRKQTNISTTAQQHKEPISEAKHEPSSEQIASVKLTFNQKAVLKLLITTTILDSNFKTSGKVSASHTGICTDLKSHFHLQLTIILDA